MLEAALFRPQTGYYADLIEEAAALWESLTVNHPFLDGNKRAGFAVALTFLAINGVRVVADPNATHRFIDDHLRAGTFDFPRLTAWLREHATSG